MIKSLLAAASAAALFAAVSPAAAQVGQIGLNYGKTDIEAFGAAAAGAAWQLEGAAAFQGGPLNGQIEGSVTRFDADGDDADVFSATGHLTTPVGAGYVGGFLGVQGADDATLWGVGVEGKTQVQNVSLHGQLGYGRADDLDDVDFWAVRGEGRYFFADNFRVGASAGFSKVDGDGFDTDLYNLGLDAEYQFAGTPVSVIGGYERGKWDALDLTTDTFRIGVRYSFGGDLRARDAAGVGQGSVSNLFGGTIGSALIAAAGAL